MIGQLFAQDFLSAGIRETPAWQSVTDAGLESFLGQKKGNYAQFKVDSNLNEPVTENEIIVRVLNRLGWTDIHTQQVASKSRREDVPDVPSNQILRYLWWERCLGIPLIDARYGGRHRAPGGRLRRTASGLVESAPM